MALLSRDVSEISTPLAAAERVLSNTLLLGRCKLQLLLQTVRGVMEEWTTKLRSSMEACPLLGPPSISMVNGEYAKKTRFLLLQTSIVSTH